MSCLIKKKHILKVFLKIEDDIIEANIRYLYDTKFRNDWMLVTSKHNQSYRNTS